MVAGIDKLREHFAGHEDRYAIIGGAACSLLFDEAGLGFRSTKDIDMVLCVEVVDAAFGEAFKSFIDAGGYEARERIDGRKEFHRFHNPTDENYPFMIKLFSRKPEASTLPDDAELTPIPVEEDAVGLSAILFEDNHHAALQGAKRTVKGVMSIDETLLIPFKARAFLDLTEWKARGGKIDSQNIEKHRRDVFRLARLLPGDAAIDMPAPIKEDMRQFLEQAEADNTLNPMDFDVPLTRDEGVAILRSAYQLA